MAWVLAAGAKRMRDEINELWPNRDKASDGSIGDASHSARVSDHNPDGAGYVLAIDIDADLDPKKKNASWLLADQIRLIARKDKRIKYVIHQGKIASARSLWRWRAHSGAPHMHHIHVSFNTSARADRSAFHLKRGY